jgi:prohibitin 2
MRKIIFMLPLLLISCHQNEPMQRSIEVSFGKAEEKVYREGLYFYNPLAVDILKLSTANQSIDREIDVYSSDLQPVKTRIRIQYEIPETSVKNILVNYQGNVVNNFVIPKVVEALKEITSTKTAENIVKQRDDIKRRVLELSKIKLNNLVNLTDVVIEDTELSDSLEKAIESKMIQEQEAEKSKFLQEQAKIEAQTKIIRAQAEAKSAEILGKAVSDNPKIIQIEMIKKWDGKMPQVLDGNNSLIMSLK